jgi:hypothetical protein
LHHHPEGARDAAQQQVVKLTEKLAAAEAAGAADRERLAAEVRWCRLN